MFLILNVILRGNVMRYLIFVVFMISQSVFADWTGTYASVSQQGLAVEFNAQNEYLLYAIQNGQQSNIEFGQLSFQGNQVNFKPQNSVTGTLTPTSASVIKEGCIFTWGQAGEFRNAKAECQQATSASENIISTFTSGSNLLEIPKLALPNATGGVDLYKVSFKLIGTSPLNLQLQSAEPVAKSSNAMSGLYYPQEQIIYLPVLAVDPNTPQMLPIFQLAFKVISFEPFVVTQYAPFQYQYQNYANQPQYQSQPNYSSYESMQRTIAETSRIMQEGHELSLAIINNMGGTSCNGQYDPSNGCY
jgi:hypothetical protein